MIVVDTSAVVAALVGRPAPGGLIVRLSTAGELHAPHLLDVEFLHALRRLVLTGEISAPRADAARRDAADLTIIRYPHHPLLDRMWGLRHDVTPYDASFLALAEALDAPLVTCDRHLARSAGHRARTELFEA